MLRQMGIFDPAVPATLRELRTMGQRTPEEMIDNTTWPATLSATCWWWPAPGSTCGRTWKIT
jgi:hypothetical protein